MKVRLARWVNFSSGHRYWLPQLSDQQNRDLFGPWASPYNHGHNYRLLTTTEGEIDPLHGMVVNIKAIDDILQAHVVAKFDQKSINDEVPEFQDQSPSTENLLRYFRNVLQSLDLGAKLVGLRLEETPLLYAEWNAPFLENQLTITRVYEFAASHRLHAPSLSAAENVELFGKCNNISGHGHNYVLEVTVGGKPDDQTGMVANISALDEVVEHEVVGRYDHKNFNVDIPEFAGLNPTSEVVAMTIFNRLKSKVPAQLVRVRLHETARNIFEVNAD